LLVITGITLTLLPVLMGDEDERHDSGWAGRQTPAKINLLKISLLAFTGFRTYHFRRRPLPSDAFIVAIFGLAAIDLGVVL
ncbi:hypothetical protein, partial [Candidatus Amarolinea dominans]|uniref:hypothetical protein n=1 Tax=Candidatus Amarolinea dominans TaxID=3140696 RepID=UPI0031CCB2FF